MASTGKLKLEVLATGLAALLAVALLALLATQPADAARRFKVVTKTFSNSQQITMFTGSEAATPYPSERNVGGFRRGKILDANLTLKNFSHTFPDDVDVMISHRGVNRTVMSDVGGGEDEAVNNITLKLDDEAALPLSDEGELTAGTFKPTNFETDTFPAPAPTPSGLTKLSGFDGKNPNGTWSLWVVDDNSPDGGQFAGGWSITIKARVLR